MKEKYQSSRRNIKQILINYNLITNSMKLLLLPAYFTPELVSDTPLDDARYEAFAQAGFDMSLITSNPTRGVSEKDKNEYKKRTRERMYDNKMLVRRFPMIDEGKNPVGRAVRYFLCFVKQYFYGKKEKDTDVIFVVSTPPIQGMLAALLKTKLHCKFVYNLQDIFPDTLVGAGLAKKGGFLWKIGRIIEDYTYKHADKIIVISQDFKRNIMAKGVPEEKIEIVYNWVDENAVHPVSKDENRLFDEFGLSRELFTIVYAGNLGNAQNINIIIDAAKLLPNVQFAIFGTGGLENDIRRRIEDEKLSNMHLNPLQPINKVSEVYSLGDVCVVSCKEGLGGSAMPSKTWTIMSCGRPVLASFDEGELETIIENNGCGLFTHAENLQEFTDAIQRLSGDSDKCKEMGENARWFILNNLTKAVGTKRYVEIISQMAELT